MIAGPTGLLATIARWNTLLEEPAMTGTFSDPDPAGPSSPADGEAAGRADRAQPSAGLLQLDVSATPEASDAALATLPPAPPSDGPLAGRDFTAMLGLASLTPPATLWLAATSERGDAGQALEPPPRPTDATSATPGSARDAAQTRDRPAPADGPSPAQTVPSAQIAALPAPTATGAELFPGQAATPTDALSGRDAPSPAALSAPAAGEPRDFAGSTGHPAAALTAEMRAATPLPEPRGSTTANRPAANTARTPSEAADRPTPDTRVSDPDRALRPPPSDSVVQARTAGGGIDLLDARTNAVLATLVAGSDPQPGAGTIIPSCIINAAMIPGWPPPRPFDHPAPKTLLGQMARQQTEAQLLDALAKRHGGDINRWRQRLARLARSRRLRTLLGFEAIMSTIEALIEAIEEELLRLSTRDRSPSPSEDEQDDLAQSGLQRRLTA